MAHNEKINSTLDYSWRAYCRYLRLANCYPKAFLHFLFHRIKLPKGESAAAYHSYLKQPTKPIHKAFKASGLLPPRTVFEAGCGCGKNLYYFQDKYGSDIDGLDLSESDIAVAKKVDIHGGARFYCRTLEDGLGYRRTDLVITNNYLSNIEHLPNFEPHLDELLKFGKNMLVIETSTPRILSALCERGFHRLDFPNQLVMVK